MKTSFIGLLCLVAATPAIALTTTPATYSCMAPDQALALDTILSWHFEGKHTSIAPLVDHSVTCVTSKLAFSLIDQVSALELNKTVAAQINTPTGHVEKRIRTCPEVKNGAIGGVSKYSCDSTKDPSGCRICATSSTAVLVTACAACAAKVNQESLPCCITAAATFTTYYLKNCVKTF
ncbi:hypothetical protein ACN47E_006145 [Coniothyrium glycines]